MCEDHLADVHHELVCHRTFFFPKSNGKSSDSRESWAMLISRLAYKIRHYTTLLTTVHKPINHDLFCGLAAQAGVFFYM